MITIARSHLPDDQHEIDQDEQQQPPLPHPSTAAWNTYPQSPRRLHSQVSRARPTRLHSQVSRASTPGPPQRVESRPPSRPRIETSTPTHPKLSTEEPSHIRIHRRIPTLQANGDNFPIWKQALTDMALINGMENIIDPAYTTPDQQIPMYYTYRGKSAIICMAINNSLPPYFAATADLQLDSSSLQLSQAIIAHFTEGTTTAHLLLKQEADSTKMWHTVTLDEYITKHRSIRTRMKLAEYPNIPTGEAVTVQFIIQVLSTHPTYKHLKYMWIDTGTIPDNIQNLVQRLKAVHARSIQKEPNKAGTQNGLKLPENQKDAQPPPGNRMEGEAVDEAEANDRPGYHGRDTNGTHNSHLNTCHHTHNFSRLPHKDPTPAPPCSHLSATKRARESTPKEIQ